VRDPLEPVRHGRVGYLGRLAADKEVALVLEAAADAEPAP